jgi:hypothetical protein
MNVRTILRLAAILGALHLVVAMGSLLLGFSLGMARFDSPESIAPGYVETTSSHLADVLFQPMQAIYRAFYAGSSAPAAVEWLSMILNSAFWGIALAVGVASIRSRLGTK